MFSPLNLRKDASSFALLLKPSESTLERFAISYDNYRHSFSPPSLTDCASKDKFKLNSSGKVNRFSCQRFSYQALGSRKVLCHCN